MDFEKVIKAIAEFFERRDARFALAGAWALHAYGLSRMTSDVDFVAESSVRDPLVEHLESLGYETLYVSSGYSNHLHPDADLGRVDFIYVDDSTARKLLDQPARVFRIGGLHLPVPRPEHLAAMKIHAMKNDPRRTLREKADLGFLLTLEEIDEDEVRRYFEKAGLEEVFDDIKRSL